MRKQLFTPTPRGIQSHGESWLDLDRAASIEATSEEKEYPAESAWSQEKFGADEPPILALKPFG